MKYLHICNDLMGSKVHENLYLNLNHLGLDQTLYHPLRKHNVQKVEKFNTDLKKILICSKPLHSHHRILFRRKITFLYQDIEKKMKLDEQNIVHATTLFSDGAIAYKIKKRYGIPYIIAVRGTDINLFLKYRFDLYPLAKKIITCAEHVVFISNSLKDSFFQHHLIKNLNTSKIPPSCVIPNGLNPFWLKNIRSKRKEFNPSKFLYIGKFNSNKNVLRLVKAFLLIKDKYENLQLNLVGKGGSQEKEIRELAKKYSGTINFHGPIYDKKKLQKMYQANDIFLMASISETFGLVYVEALTQGLPILYTKNQGIHGTFKELVGEAVNPKSISSIAQGMELILNNYPDYEVNTIDFTKFSWDNISSKYLELYKNVLTKA